VLCSCCSRGVATYFLLRYKSPVFSSYISFRDGERRGQGGASPGRLERTPKFFRGQRVGDGNNIYIYIYINFKIHHKHL
jgi:hypothetical protein